jgi:imidazolonepropionase-like amidohydrolase
MTFMKRSIATLALIGIVLSARAQKNIYPAPAQTADIYITGATVHVGNGTVLENTTIRIKAGKIDELGSGLQPASGATVIDARGKHVYPGLIQSNVSLGLVEVSSVRATSDQTEIGDLNPSIRSIVAYNTDSEVIWTLRNNGILLANTVPAGGLISGTSSVVQLDAWNWEDAAYQMDNAMHFQMPSLLARVTGFAAFFQQQQPGDRVQRGLENIERVKAFLREARSYIAQAQHGQTNLKFEALRPLFEGRQKLFVHCNIVREMLIAVDMAKEFKIGVVIVGGSDSWQIADILKENNISVVLSQMHALPTMVDDDVDQPYKTPALLQKAGVQYCINDDDASARGRNLAFNAGTAVAYGLTKEEALAAITLNAAKILGIADRTGSVEKGKDANLVISEGDILDMRSQIITHAFIQGRQLNLDDKHKQLYEKYKYKYGIR